MWKLLVVTCLAVLTVSCSGRNKGELGAAISEATFLNAISSPQALELFLSERLGDGKLTFYYKTDRRLFALFEHGDSSDRCFFVVYPQFAMADHRDNYVKHGGVDLLSSDGVRVSNVTLKRESRESATAFGFTAEFNRSDTIDICLSFYGNTTDGGARVFHELSANRKEDGSWVSSLEHVIE